MNTTVSSRIGRRKLMFIGLIAVFFCLAIAARRGRTVGRGTPIVYDDFAFSIKDVRTSRGHGPESDRGRLMTVTLQIANQARRVSYNFNPGHLIVSDDSGSEYRIDPTEQKKLDESNPPRSTQQPPIRAGESATFDLVFRVPSDLRHPRMRLTSGGPIGDLLESLTAESRDFDLEP